jgi:sugar O-acyltransferase (sialic acid O-acetyltransferase NeuD family)
MSTLVVVAASGLAREALAVPGALDAHDHVVIVDDDPGRWGGEHAGFPVLEGGLDRVTTVQDSEVLVCVGSGRGRRAVVRRLAALGVDRYASVRHPSVSMPPGCTVGPGSILLAGVVLTCDVRVGRHVVAMPHVTLTHDDVVEDFATLCAGVTLGGTVTVCEAAYLGMGSSVREGVVVGSDATLGMGAALLDDLPAGETWAGVPARALVRGASTEVA